MGAALLREVRDTEAVKERTDWAAIMVMFFFVCGQLFRYASSSVFRPNHFSPLCLFCQLGARIIKCLIKLILLIGALGH